MLPVIRAITGRTRDAAIARSSERAVYGAAVLESEAASQSPIGKLIAETCELIVPAGPMHWRYLRPTPTAFDYSAAERCVGFAVRNGQLVRGHCLVWHDMLPNWLQRWDSRTEAEFQLSNHITSVVRHFAGRIHSWDVVNEVVDPASGRADNLRDTLWLRALGPEYVASAFRLARRADPRSLLGYNEYGIEDNSAQADRKREAVLSLLTKLRIDGVPIDYLGVQSHLASGKKYSDAKLGEFLREVKRLGLQVFITELDVDDRSLPTDLQRRDNAVAELYDRYLSVAMGSVSIPVVVTWGLTDRASWLQRRSPRSDGSTQRPLPFDSELRPKKAWSVLSQYIKQRA